MPKEVTFRVLPAQLEMLIEQLRDAEATLVRAQRQFGDDELWTFRESSFARASESLESFISDLKLSMRAHAAGDPWGPDTLKARSLVAMKAATKRATKKKPPKK